MSRAWLRVSLVAALLLFAGAAFAQTADAEHGLEQDVAARWARFEPRFREQACPFDVRLTPSARPRVRCGYVLVPEDRNDPGTSLIKLSVVRLAAPAGSRSTLAVALLIPGGPGAPTIDFVFDVLARDGELPAINDSFELVAFDQRGVGYSEHALCREVPRPWLRGVPMIPDGEAAFREDMRRCLEEARTRGIAVDAYSTWHSALDVRDVRRALGYEQWNLWGGSYGARLAQAVMQLDAAGVRAAILDSPIPAVLPDDATWLGLATGLRAALDNLRDTCRLQPGCVRDAGDVAARFEAALADYASRPLVLEGLDATVFTDGVLVLDGQLLASTLFLTLYSAAISGGLPVFLDAVERRDADALAAVLTALLRGTRAGHSFGVGLNFVTNCRSDHILTSPAVRSTEPLSRWTIEPQLGDNAPERCRAAYRVDPDASVVELISDIPTLVLAGAADPATPPAFARAILPGLRNGNLLEVPHTGHGVIPELNSRSRGCGDALAGAFYRDPQAVRTVPCPGAIGPTVLLTGVRATHRPFRFVEGIRGGARPVLPALTVAGLLFALVAFPLAGLGRAIDPPRGPRLRGVRSLAWLGAASSLAGVGVAAAAIWLTVTRYPLAFPSGVVPEVVWAGWLSVLGVLMSGAALVGVLRRRRETAAGIGPIAGIAATALLASAALVFLLTLGAGPF